MFSAGRDKNIWLTDLRQNNRHTLVCREAAPVLKMILTPDQVALRVHLSFCVIHGYEKIRYGSGSRPNFDTVRILIQAKTIRTVCGSMQKRLLYQESLKSGSSEFIRIRRIRIRNTVADNTIRSPPPPPPILAADGGGGGVEY